MQTAWPDALIGQGKIKDLCFLTETFIDCLRFNRWGNEEYKKVHKFDFGFCNGSQHGKRKCCDCCHSQGHDLAS